MANVQGLGGRGTGGPTGSVAATTRPDDLAYRADIDGLRAVAVLAVILYHLDEKWLAGGFVGVDVFFVISGYLITRILVRDLEAGKFSLLNFYDRRIRRILPAFLVMLLATSIAAVLVLWPEDLRAFGRNLIAVALSVGNFQFAGQAGYFSPAAELMPLLHTWSLAVEEQFYLLYPPLLWLAWRQARSRLVHLFAVVLAVSFIACLGATWAYPKLAFFHLPFRAWELLLGAMLALGAVPAPSARWQRELAAAVGLSLILGACLAITAGTPFPGLAALAPCLGAAAIIWSGEHSGRTRVSFAALLSHPASVFLGKISYSLYLWHWPLIVFAKHLIAGPLVLETQAALFVLTFLTAVASWRWIEVPLRSGQVLWPRQIDRFWATAGVVAVFVATGLLVQLTQGMPSRISEDLRTLRAAASDFSPHRARCHGDGLVAQRLADTCVLGGAGPGSSAVPEAIVFADSHGVEIAAALADVAGGELGGIRQITTSGCPPVLGVNPQARPNCGRIMAEVLAELQRHPPATIIVTAHYEAYRHAAAEAALWLGLETSLRLLRDAGHKVILLGPLPAFPSKIPVPSALARWVQFGGDPAEHSFRIDVERLAAMERRLRAIAAAAGGRFVQLSDLLCAPDGRCRTHIAGKTQYFDDNHLSLAGARRVVADRLLPILRPR